jgi:hypothetical protein
MLRYIREYYFVPTVVLQCPLKGAVEAKALLRAVVDNYRRGTPIEHIPPRIPLKLLAQSDMDAWVDVHPARVREWGSRGVLFGPDDTYSGDSFTDRLNTAVFG